MSARLGEDVAAQVSAVSAAGSELANRLDILAREATLAARTARRKSRGAVNLDDVLAAEQHVRRAEEALDLALLDLATAGGEDA